MKRSIMPLKKQLVDAKKGVGVYLQKERNKITNLTMSENELYDYSIRLLAKKEYYLVDLLAYFINL